MPQRIKEAFEIVREVIANPQLPSILTSLGVLREARPCGSEWNDGILSNPTGPH